MFESNQVATLNAKTKLVKLNKETNQIVTTSIHVAKIFEKEHKHVLDSIRNILENRSAENSADLVSMFIETTYTDKSNRQKPMFLMNRDGFSLLAMGFTGEKALKFKLDFIKAFNEMEQQLQQPIQPKIPKTRLELAKENARIAIENVRLIEEIEEKEQLLLEANNTIQEQEPLVNFANQVIADDETYTITDVWKLIGSKMKQQDFFQKCRDIGLITKSNHPVADAIRAGLIVKCMGTASTGYEYIQTRVTGKGIKRICEKLKIRTKLIF